MEDAPVLDVCSFLSDLLRARAVVTDLALGLV